MKSIWIAMNMGTRWRGQGSSNSKTMADCCARGSLQIRPSKCLNVSEWVNLREKIIIALIFHLLFGTPSMLMKETSDKNFFINIKLGNNIPFPIFCLVNTAWKLSIFGVILVRMRENAAQNNSEYGLFLGSERL